MANKGGTFAELVDGGSHVAAESLDSVSAVSVNAKNHNVQHIEEESN